MAEKPANGKGRMTDEQITVSYIAAMLLCHHGSYSGTPIMALDQHTGDAAVAMAEKIVKTVLRLSWLRAEKLR